MCCGPPVNRDGREVCPYVAEIVDRAPPLTDEQIRRLRRLVRAQLDEERRALSPRRRRGRAPE